MRIYSLKEGIYYINKQKEMFAEGDPELSNKNLQLFLKLSITPFLISLKDELIILDTGTNRKNENNELSIIRKLKDLGFKPSDITTVFISHLHSDHYGGMFNLNETHNLELTFKNAQHLINKNDFEKSIEKLSSHFSTSQKIILQLLENKVNFIEDKIFKNQYFEIENTGGHSEFHQTIKIKENEEIVFFGGDVAPQLSQMKTQFKAKYDFDPTIAKELREKWWQKGLKEHWTFLFYHDLQNSIHKTL